MKIKVCGLRDIDNINSILTIKPDFLGFIFYKKSPRFVNNKLANEIKNINHDYKVGVFVNASLEEILKKSDLFGLNYAQLHGNEHPKLLAKLQQKGIKTIKVFHIDDNFDTSSIEPYNEVADYFLFDTKTKLYGGSGKKFNWAQLDTLKLSKPFLLGGGITAQDVEEILNLKHSLMLGIDINSAFEFKPGIKNADLVQSFVQKIRENEK